MSISVPRAEPITRAESGDRDGAIPPWRAATASPATNSNAATMRCRSSRKPSSSQESSTWLHPFVIDTTANSTSSS